MLHPDEVSDPKALTPIEQKGDMWIKRDDKFSIAGVAGGKVRTCWHLSQGATGLITAGSRMSPQVNIVAHIAKRLGVPCRVHVPQGELSPEVVAARDAGAKVMQHKAGYNNVIIARAKDDAKQTGWREIPFGMDCQEAVEQTRRQVNEIPPGVKRIVMPVGSAMSLCGVLHGLQDAKLDIPVLGVCVGAEPRKRLHTYAPTSEVNLGEMPSADWMDMVELVQSTYDYHTPYKESLWRGVTIDPIYEAKCLPYLMPGDLLWVVGIRQTFAKPDQVWHP